MSNTYGYDDDDQDNQSPQVTLSRKQIRQLEKRAKAADEAQAELEQLKRERAFVQAGVPLDDRRASYFIAGYQGEMTPEAIKARWAEDFGAAQQGDPAIAGELDMLNAAQDLVSTGGDLSESRLQERNAKLAALSTTDPRYHEKFDAIFAEYGGQMAARSNMTGAL